MLPFVYTVSDGGGSNVERDLTQDAWSSSDEDDWLVVIFGETKISDANPIVFLGFLFCQKVSCVCCDTYLIFDTSTHTNIKIVSGKKVQIKKKKKIAVEEEDIRYIPHSRTMDELLCSTLILICIMLHTYLVYWIDLNWHSNTIMIHTEKFPRRIFPRNFWKMGAQTSDGLGTPKLGFWKCHNVSLDY